MSSSSFIVHGRRNQNKQNIPNEMRISGCYLKLTKRMKRKELIKNSKYWDGKKSCMAYRKKVPPKTKNSKTDKEKAPELNLLYIKPSHA